MNTSERGDRPTSIEVRGARVHNLKDIDLDIPLGVLVGLAGVSGSGKSSLAMGVLYAEGSRRYIEALSAYTRRRMGQAPRADVDRVTHVPAALALRQRPGVPGVRSTFGTSTELLNVLRLMFSRLGSHVCPNGHRQAPTVNVATEQSLVCPECGVSFFGPEAEDLAFNAGGACPECGGIGTVREVEDSALIRDESLTIDEGTVLPWQMFGFNVQPQIAREFGVRTDVPWRDLSAGERDIVLAGPEEKKHIVVTTKKGVQELDFTFRNARLTVTEELRRAEGGKRLERVDRFLRERICSSCSGARLSPEARAPQIGTKNLAAATALTLEQLVDWAPTVPGQLPEHMRSMAESLVQTLQSMARRLLELGLGYLALDRPGATLSTGERQRVQLARAVRNETTGVLYVLDEPSIGLHPANLGGLQGVFEDLLRGGNSVLMVDHDVQVLRAADHLIEIGPGAGRTGGEVVACGSVADLEAEPQSRIGRCLSGEEHVSVRDRAPAEETFDHGTIRLATQPVHTVHALEAAFPRGRLTVVTGVSGSGKTTLVLDSLVPGLRAAATDGRRPEHVREIEPCGIQKVHVVDATPIGVNVRSTVATYSGVLDELRRSYAQLDSARAAGLSASDFSYNTGSLRCPRCDGNGRISLDLQFLPDEDITCPVCDGTRYSSEVDEYDRPSADGRFALSLPQLLTLTVDEAVERLEGPPKAVRRLQALSELGLGYLTLNESTPALSGGEAQRLKLVTQLGSSQTRSLFVFDEPTVGLHPADVRVLIQVLQRLVDRGGTVVVIEHDLDLMANADHLIDLGPGGGAEGGRIVTTGTPEQVAADEQSLTGRHLAGRL